MNYAIVAMVAFLLGYITEIGVLMIRGRRILVPFISASSRNFTLAAVALSLVALLTIVNIQTTNDEAAACDRQFREALRYNTDLTAEQRDLNARATQISADRRVLLDKLFANLPTAIESSGRTSVYQLVSNYNVQAAQLAREYDRLIAYRNSLDKTRKPYPEPTCGK